MSVLISGKLVVDADVFHRRRNPIEGKRGLRNYFELGYKEQFRKNIG